MEPKTAHTISIQLRTRRDRLGKMRGDLSRRKVSNKPIGNLPERIDVLAAEVATLQDELRTAQMSEARAIRQRAK